MGLCGERVVSRGYTVPCIAVRFWWIFSELCVTIVEFNFCDTAVTVRRSGLYSYVIPFVKYCPVGRTCYTDRRSKIVFAVCQQNNPVFWSLAGRAAQALNAFSVNSCCIAFKISCPRVIPPFVKTSRHPVQIKTAVAAFRKVDRVCFSGFSKNFSLTIIACQQFVSRFHFPERQVFFHELPRMVQIIPQLIVIFEIICCKRMLKY